MKKVKKINQKNIKKIVKEHFLGNDFLLPENKIDDIIKEYLSERDNFLDEEEPLNDKTTFSKKSQEAIRDMVVGLTEIVGDLEVIKEKEDNVLIYQDTWADEVLEPIIENIYSVMEDLTEIDELTNDDLEDDLYAE